MAINRYAWDAVRARRHGGGLCYEIGPKAPIPYQIPANYRNSVSTIRSERARSTSPVVPPVELLTGLRPMTTILHLPEIGQLIGAVPRGVVLRARERFTPRQAGRKPAARREPSAGMGYSAVIVECVSPRVFRHARSHGRHVGADDCRAVSAGTLTVALGDAGTGGAQRGRWRCA
jgi:hypothetical protein